ncbi:MAG TPA: hypothetical protein VGX50_13305, partial [Longimicrobium sp.]|nr:hypothetical protein [Longimicrobium sp.]
MAVLAIAFASTATGCRARNGGAVNADLPAALARELALVPGIGPRLSIAGAYRSCSLAEPAKVSAFGDGCATVAAAGVRSDRVTKVA